VKILERHKTWIHTHFVTDGARLSAHHVRDVEARMRPFLRALGIVFGVRFEAHKGEAGVRIVLECIPLPETLDLIQAELQRIIDPIPARPRTVMAVGFTPPKEEPRQQAGRAETRDSAKPVPAGGRRS
jgi:hypothetical protein